MTSTLAPATVVPRSRRPLTPRQREIFDYLVTFIDTHGYAPSLQEIGAALGMRSLATVSAHMENLHIKAWIRRGWNRSRDVTIIPPPECCATCGRPLPEAKVSHIS